MWQCLDLLRVPEIPFLYLLLHDYLSQISAPVAFLDEGAFANLNTEMNIVLLFALTGILIIFTFILFLFLFLIILIIPFSPKGNSNMYFSVS